MTDKLSCRTLFLNSGILGHKAVASLVRDAVSLDPEIEAMHIDLSALTATEHVVRAVMCARLMPRRLGGANLGFERWRAELHIGRLAARRIKAAEALIGRADVLHFHTQAAAYGSLRRMRQTPSIVSIDCTQTQDSLGVESTVGRFPYWPNIHRDIQIFHLARAIVAPSRWAADAVASRLPACAPRLHVLPWPVRLDLFDSAWSEERYARAPQHRRPVQVLFVGGDFERKGGFDLLAAWQEGRFQRFAQLTLVTEWPLNKAMLPLGVTLRRGIRPYSSQWREMWRDADVFVMPTRGEAFGLAYQEAAAAGLPVVGTRLNAIPEIVIDGTTGLLVSKENLGSLVRAMGMLIESADRRREMGTAGRRRMEAEGGVSRYGDRLSAIIKSIGEREENRRARVVMTPKAPPTRVLFVNPGILGMRTFATFIKDAMTRAPDLDATHVVLTEGMTPGERIVRWLMCVQLWPDLRGLRNLDLARFRQELHAGVQASRRIRPAVREIDFDVLYFHRQPAAYASLSLMRRVPSIVSIDCTQDCALSTATTPLERLTFAPSIRRDGAVFRHAAAIVATSEWARRSVQTRYPDCTTPIYVMPTPVIVSAFGERWIDERMARAATPGYRPRVLFIGGDFPRKGGFDLLKAWLAGSFYHRADLDIVTDWPLNRRKLPPSVRVLQGITAYTRPWLELWRAADLLVLPTRDEAFALVFQEAAAAGLPRIGTTINAVPEMIEHGESGLLIPPADPGAIVEALKTLLASGARRREMGARARQKLIERASPERYIAQLREIIASLVADRDGERRAGVA